MNFFGLNLPVYPGEYAESDVLTALNGAVDSNSQSIWGTLGARRGTDAEILDAIVANPQPEHCPCVFIQTWTEQEQSSIGGRRAYTPYMMSLYFMYYFGVPSADLSYQPSTLSFTQQRRRHLQAALQILTMQSGGNVNAVIATSPHWKWDTDRKRVIDYRSPFQYFGDGNYSVKDGYNCVRVDCPISIYQ